jgi:hypothetical protein
MIKDFEKNKRVRMECNCGISYKQPGFDQIHEGRCISISGAGITFITSEHHDSGIAMVIQFTEKNTSIPTDITVFIEIVRVTKHDPENFRISALIKSIKSNNLTKST